MDITVTVTGLESIDEDFKAFQKELSAKVAAAMDDVGADMSFALQEHIQKDVYDKYSPKVYQRRSENGSLGRPLIDPQANITINNRGEGLSLIYSPTGEHSNASWHTADDDDLIRRIEQKSPPYFAKAQGKVPPRPFWQNFVNEMTDQDKMAIYFAQAMREQGIEVELDTGVEREAADGDY